MKRINITIIALSLLIVFFSVYISLQSLRNVAQVEKINQIFVEDEEIDLEVLYYHHENIKGVSGVISKIAWSIIVLTLINTSLVFYVFFQSKKSYRK
jgi:hypothetical protein